MNIIDTFQEQELFQEKGLTNDQQRAFDDIKAWIKLIGKGNEMHTLVGFAGTGKTFLTKYILHWAQENNIRVAGLAPTHKARKVLELVLNQTSFIPVPTMTVASFLMKLKQHSYVGTKHYKGNGLSKASQYDLFFIDECSMICDKDVDQIVQHIKTAGKKGLFIGDKGQIPNPVQDFEENEDGTISKKDSKSFSYPTSILTEIKRQQEEHPLLNIYTTLRQHVFTEPELDRTNNMVTSSIGNIGVKFYEDKDRFHAKIKRTILKVDRKKITEYKAIAYTNDTVKNYNLFIREVLGYQEKFVIGDILIGYNNVGYPVHVVENGEEYSIQSIKQENGYVLRYLNEVYSCSGTILQLKTVDTGVISIVFVPNINSKENLAIFTKLKELAKGVNKKGSTVKEFKLYAALKNQLIFMENVYEYAGKIMSESELKERHPKLFHLANYYLGGTTNKLTMKATRSVEKFNNLYPNILPERIKDNKPISDSERIVDRFQLIEKDIDYGYAITCHKSQGSTYHTVFIDEKDFNKIGNKWNAKFESEENGTKEKNQLKYVAYTRPTNCAFCLY